MATFQFAPKLAQKDPKWPQMRARLTPKWPKMRPKMNQNDLKEAQAIQKYT